MGIDDDNLRYTKDEIKKNLILLEDHFKKNPCPDCVNKHLLAVEGYADEGILLTNNEQEKVDFFNLAQQMRQARKKFNSIS